MRGVPITLPNKSDKKLVGSTVAADSVMEGSCGIMASLLGIVAAVVMDGIATGVWATKASTFKSTTKRHANNNVKYLQLNMMDNSRAGIRKQLRQRQQAKRSIFRYIHLKSDHRRRVTRERLAIVGWTTSCCGCGWNEANTSLLQLCLETSFRSSSIR